MQVHYSSKSNEWETPKFIFNQLNDKFDFDLDAAATPANALVSTYFTQEDDSLSQNWSLYKSIWCNPPYGKMISKFIEKGYNSGTKVVFLIPARTDTKWWHQYVSKGQVLFIKGRLKFQNRTFPSWKEDYSHKVSPANFPTAIVIFNNGEPITAYVDQNELIKQLS